MMDEVLKSAGWELHQASYAQRKIGGRIVNMVQLYYRHKFTREMTSFSVDVGTEMAAELTMHNLMEWFKEKERNTL